MSPSSPRRPRGAATDPASALASDSAGGPGGVQSPARRLESFARLLHHLGWVRSLEKDPHPLRLDSDEAARRPGAPAALAAAALAAAAPASRRSAAAASSPRRGNALAPEAREWWALHSIDPALPLFSILTPAAGAGGLVSPRRFAADFEDLDPSVARLLHRWRQFPPLPDAIVVLDEDRAVLYHAPSEQVIAFADSAEEIAETVLPHLTYREVAGGNLREFSARTDDELGQCMADWTHHWVSEAGSTLGLERPLAQAIVEATVLARVADQLGFSPGRTRLADAALNLPPDDRLLGAAAGPSAGGAALSGPSTGRRSAGSGGGPEASTGSARLEPLRRAWRTLYQAKYLDAVPGYEALSALAASPPGEVFFLRLLESLHRLARRRFGALPLAHSQLDPALRHRTWAAAVAEQVPLPAGVADPADAEGWLSARWSLDLEQVGLVHLLRAFDLATSGIEAYNRIQAARISHGIRSSYQPGLFDDPGASSLSARLQVPVPVHHVLTRTLQLTAQSPSLVRAARTALLVRTLERLSESAPALAPLPTFTISPGRAPASA